MKFNTRDLLNLVSSMDEDMMYEIEDSLDLYEEEDDRRQSDSRQRKKNSDFSSYSAPRNKKNRRR